MNIVFYIHLQSLLSMNPKVNSLYIYNVVHPAQAQRAT